MQVTMEPRLIKYLLGEFEPESFVELLSTSGTEDDVVRSARVSFGNDHAQFGNERDAKLLKFLMANGHWSPFEHVHATFHVSAPIPIARQWMRHKSWSFNEISMRYTRLNEKWYIPDRLRSQADSNRQASTEWAGETDEEYKKLEKVYWKALDEAFYAYDQLIEGGVCREQARFVLPLATYTRFYATCNLRSLIHFLQVRSHSDAQWEMVQYANAVRRLAEAEWPTIMETVG